MKVIVAGGRDIEDFMTVTKAIMQGLVYLNAYSLTKPIEIVSGMARGVDSLAIEFASAIGYSIKTFPADWDKYGKSAGPTRNKQMAEYSDALIAIWDGKSRGTKNMIVQMEKIGKPVYVHRI